MKTYNDVGAQGDLLFVRVDRLPEGLKPLESDIVAHSESGHHHRARPQRGFRMERFAESPTVSYIKIARKREELAATADAATAAIDEALKGAGVVIEHEKTGPDAHEASGLACEGEEAIYQVLRQREMRPEGWAIVAD